MSGLGYGLIVSDEWSGLWTSEYNNAASNDFNTQLKLTGLSIKPLNTAHAHSETG